MPMNVPGFHLRSYCNNAKNIQIATTSSVAVSSSSSRKAGGVAIYCNINRFIDYSNEPLTVLELMAHLKMKYAKAGDIYVS